MAKNEPGNAAERTRLEALDRYYAKDYDAALALLDQAAAQSADEAFLDLIQIHRASIHVEQGENSPAVQELPRIMMRRTEHRGLAAYHLATKFENEHDFGRARFYLEISRDSAEAAGDRRLHLVSLIDLGNVCVYDSKAEDAIPYYRQALEALETIETRTERERILWRGMAVQNLGYCSLLMDRFEDGVQLIHEAVDDLSAAGGDWHLAESYLDLCFGYLGMEKLDQAWEWGSKGRDLATEDRQVRNSLYLLGETAYKRGDYAAAETLFDGLARFYPDFPQLKNVLLALDLRRMVNFKL